MADNVLPLEEADSAELWLLPDLNGKRVISGGASDADAFEPTANHAANGYGASAAKNMAGFSRAAAPKSNDKHTVGRTIPRAISASALEQIEQQAREEGFKQGRAEGYEKGYTEGEHRATEYVEQRASQQLAVQQQSLAQLIESIVHPLNGQRDDLQQVLTDLIELIAQRLCYRELLSDRSTIAAVVSEAVQALPIGEKQVTLRLNPADIETLQSLPDFIQPHWQLLADESLLVGDCKIRSEHSLVDFTRATRMQAILDAHFTPHTHSDNNSGPAS